jgi:hypothetical protein
MNNFFPIKVVDPATGNLIDWFNPKYIKRINFDREEEPMTLRIYLDDGEIIHYDGEIAENVHKNLQSGAGIVDRIVSSFDKAMINEGNK